MDYFNDLAQVRTPHSYFSLLLGVAYCSADESLRVGGESEANIVPDCPSASGF